MKLTSSITLPLAVLAAVAFADKYVPYGSVSKDALLEQFDDSWSERWKVSHAKRDGEFSYVGKWSVEESTVFPAFEGDKGLVVKSPAAHHAISYIFDKPFDNTNKDLVLQYEAKFQEGLSCGGAYIKLLSQDGNLDQEFNNDTPYQVMFGPDKCGATNKVHFIVRRKNPQTGEYEEKHLRVPPMSKVTKQTTLYTLVIKKNNDFEIRINGEVAKAGNLLDEKFFEPAFNPPKEIDDENDTKPEDWVDEEEIPDPEQSKKPEDWDEDAPRRIPDPEATKPVDWDESAPQYIPDPDAEKPEDWDDEEDGEWIAPEIPNPVCEDHGCGKWKAPLIPNPSFKGKWVQPLIPNPDYKGPWSPKKIPNPDYYADVNASDLEPIGGMGFELWTMDKNILFDNIYLGHSLTEAEKIGNTTFVKKLEIESELERKAMKEQVEKAPEAPLQDDDDDEDDIVQSISEKFQQFVDFTKVFLAGANNYLLELGSDPEFVLKEKPIEGLVYVGVFGFIGTVLFGVFAIILLKLTSEIDNSVDAKPATGKPSAQYEKEKDIAKNREAKVQEIVDELKEDNLEKEQAAKSTSAKASETTATKRA